MPLRLTPAEFERLKKRPAGYLRMSSGRNAGRRWEVEFESQLRAAGIEHVREHVFAAPRKFRFDFAWPDRRLALEIDGAVHRIKNRFESDREKANIATKMGWRVVHVTPKEVRNGDALVMIEGLLSGP